MARGRLGKIEVPFPNPLAGQRRHLQVAEHREDRCLGADLGVAGGLPVCLEEFEIGLHRVRHRERPVLPSGVMGAGGSTFACQGLRLLIGEDAHAIGVGEVIGDPDHLDLIGLVAHVMPRNPLASPAERLAIAEV